MNGARGTERDTMEKKEEPTRDEPKREEPARPTERKANGAVPSTTQTRLVVARDGVRSARGWIQRQMSERPYTALGAALGAGFVLGGGLTPRVAVALLGLGMRYGGAAFASEIFTLTPEAEIDAAA